MKKIFLSFGLIVVFALFSTASRRNVGVDMDRFLTPNVSILNSNKSVGTEPAQTTTDNVVTPIAKSAPVVIQEKSAKVFFRDDSDDDEEDEDDDDRRVVAPSTVVSTPKPVVSSTPTKTTIVSTPVTSTPKPAGQFADGAFTGDAADAYYGYIQVQAVIKNGKITDVIFLQHPNDRRTSIEINTQAMPYLKSEAIQSQSANVNIVSGATDSSLAFRESMSSALAKAKL